MSAAESVVRLRGDEVEGVELGAMVVRDLLVARIHSWSPAAGVNKDEEFFLVSPNQLQASFSAPFSDNFETFLLDFIRKSCRSTFQRSSYTELNHTGSHIIASKSQQMTMSRSSPCPRQI